MVGGQHEQGAALDIGVGVGDGENVGAGVDGGDGCALQVASHGPDEGGAVVADYIAAVERFVQEVVEGGAGLGVVVEVGGREEVGDVDDEFFREGGQMGFGGFGHIGPRIGVREDLIDFFPRGEIDLGRKSVTWGRIEPCSGLVEQKPLRHDIRSPQGWIGGEKRS